MIRQENTTQKLAPMRAIWLTQGAILHCCGSGGVQPFQMELWGVSGWQTAGLTSSSESDILALLDLANMGNIRLKGL